MDFEDAYGRPLVDRHINNPLLSLWNKQDIPIDVSGDVDFDMLREEIGLALDSSLQPVKPHFEGTVTFDRVWDTNSHFLNTIIQLQKAKVAALANGIDLDTHLGGGTNAFHVTDMMRMGGTARNAFHVMRAMQRAHPITVDPEQINVLPEWESIEDCVDYATHVRLPFECLFLDCELPTRSTRPSELPLFGDKLQFLGGLVAREGDMLILVPFIRVLNRSDVEIMQIDGGGVRTSDNKIDVTYFSWGAVTFNLRDNPAASRQDDMFDNSTMFRESEAQTLGLDFKLWDIDLGWLRAQLAANNPEDPNNFKLNMDMDYPHDPNPCRVHLIPPTGEHPESRVAGLTSALFRGAGEMLKILYFLDTPNIELVDAPLTRQIRRQAERSGAIIAKTIFVKHSQRRSAPTDHDDAEHLDYSHRFEVRGHWKYYPEGTRTADARPDLLRYVPGRGMCRKIWCPPFVKGPEDKPLVVKTRRVREEES